MIGNNRYQFMPKTYIALDVFSEDADYLIAKGDAHEPEPHERMFMDGYLSRRS